MKALVVLLVLGGVAAADVHTNKAAQVTLEVPKTYKLTEEPDVMRGESADKAVALFYWNVDASNADDAIKKLSSELYSSVGSLRWDKPTTAKLHGLPATWIDGTGRSVGNTLDLRVVVAGPTSTQRTVMVAAVVDHAKAGAHKAEIDGILKSLQPAK
jgi:hypothetical protein